MIHRLTIVLCAVLLLMSPVLGADYANLNEKGNSEFEKGEYGKALELYHEAEIERPETPAIYYNQANALLKSGKYEEAIEKYGKALNSVDVNIQADAYYNQGNGYGMKEDFVKAINSFEEYLKLRPGDPDAQFNIELARDKLKEQMKRQQEGEGQDQKEGQVQEPKPEQQGQKDENGPNQQEGEEVYQKDEQGEENINDPQTEQEQSGEDNKDKPPKSMAESDQAKKDEMSKEDALRILNSLDDMTDNQQKRKYTIRNSDYRGADW